MFKKLLAVAAVVATAACLSVSAFAAEATLADSKDSVSVSGYGPVDGATQYTVMLFNDSTSEIYYINQGTDASALLTNMLFKATEGENVLPVGDYTVRIGNDAGAAVDVDLKVEEENSTYTITVNVADAYAQVYLNDVLGTKVSDGVYSFEKENGTYTLVVTAPGAYTRTLTDAAVVAGEDVTVSTTLKYGDVDNEGSTTFDGLSKLIAAYNKVKGDDAYLINCDFDRNGTVNFDDLSVLIANYKKNTATVYAE